MAWTVTKEAGAVAFSDWLAQEEGDALRDSRQVPFYRPREPLMLKRAVEELDPFSAKQAPESGAPTRNGIVLGKSAAVYEDLLNRLPMMVHVMDAEGRIQSANEATAMLLGYPVEALVGTQALALLTEDSREKFVRDILPEFLRDGHFSNVDVRFRTRSGGTVDCLMSAIGHRDAQGRIERSVAIFADMSQRAAALSALERSQQRFRSAFAAAAHGMAVLTSDGLFDTVNAALADMLGFPVAELVEKRFLDIVVGNDMDKAEALFRRLVEGGRDGLQAELRYTARNEKLVQGLTSLSAVRDATGRPEQYVVQIVDITAREKAEAHLRQAQKMEAIGQLTGGMAHDFNNLLTVIIGNLQLVEAALKGNEKAEKRAREAFLAATKGSQLTKQLLAFARRQPLDAQKLDVNALIAGMGDLLKRSVGETVELKLDLMPGSPLILADPTQLETSVLNLAINARDAMPEGGRLTIETMPVRIDPDYAATQEEVTPGPYVMIAVSDTGSGIPKHLIHKVFQPFFTTKEVGRGTGLGLSMVFGFIKQSGGHIKVYSEEGRGTSIKMYLPRKLASGEHEKPAPAAREHRRVRILLVEDDDPVREVAHEFLTEFGYEVLEASNAVSALQILQDHDDIDLLFTDVVMPGGMNGFDLSQAATQLRPRLKVIHASGYPRGAIVHQEEPRLRDNLISKPYQREELRRIVFETLTSGARPAD